MQADPLHPSQGEVAPIESWDDDGDLQCPDDIQFHAISATTSVTGSVRRSGHRDSVSSRLSVRSDIESNAGDEDWQVLLRDNDDTATEEAIASARTAGIPLPSGVPKSALIGGAIKKLQSKHVRKPTIDDWSEDLEFPAADAELSLKPQEQEFFPESLQHIGTPVTASPAKTSQSVDLSPFREAETALQMVDSVNIPENHQDAHEAHDAQDAPTIKIATSSLHDAQITDPSPNDAQMKQGDDADDFEKDFELPAEDSLLKLSPPKDIAHTTGVNDDGWDMEWAEGSIGVRFGGTMRDGRSTHSSSVSAFSPSVSSCLTVESEDDGLEGLVLPDGPLNFQEALKKRQELPMTPSAVDSQSQRRSKVIDEHNDFLDDLEIGDGTVFTSMKQGVNRNIKRKIARPMTPNRSEKTITFTNKIPSPATRIPRLSGHDRTQSNLEPVSESGAPIVRFRRPQSRLGGHASRSSVSSIHTSPPTTPASRTRRSLGSRMSTEVARNDTTTSAQLLKAKRSMPSIRDSQASTSISTQRPSSRQDGATLVPQPVRARTPTDRPTSDFRSATRRLQTPFLPAGASSSQSHHASVKYSRYLRRSDSESYADLSLGQKPTTHFVQSQRSETPSRHHGDRADESTNVTAKRTVTRPARRRNYGDGNELESFDDLPTSAVTESRFVKSPVGHGAPRSVRSRLTPTPTAQSSQTETPTAAITHLNPSRPSSFTPRFARDTNASRNAREQRIASLSFSGRDRGNAALAPLSTNWKARQNSQEGEAILTLRGKKAKTSKKPSTRPQLIRPMGSGMSEPKHIKGMRYNPATYRWEGNENTMPEFDNINTPKSPKAAPALITSIGAPKGSQVVGNMVFDPQRMCWLKVASAQPGMAVVYDESDDIFAGLDDLQDRSDTRRDGDPPSTALEAEVSDDQSGGDSSEEWPITEEFDVGPEFVKRQRAEEDRWRRKVAKWVTSDRQRFGDGWRWAIRGLVPNGKGSTSLDNGGDMMH